MWRKTGAHRPIEAEGLVRRMTARPGNAHQARLLTLLRDGGPNSRAQLGDQVDLSRSKLAVEVDRLLETGLVVADGLAASRGGRRSHNIRLNPGLRFLGVDIGATSVDVAVTNAELETLGHINQPMDVREGPVAVFEQVLAMAAKLKASGLAEGFDGAGIGVPGPGPLPRGHPGGTADHARLGRLSRCGRRSARNSAARSWSTTT
ncbi:hypothetical protein SPURM210S_02244 [Streptomyces purpurascens]